MYSTYKLGSSGEGNKHESEVKKEDYEILRKTEEEVGWKLRSLFF